MSGRVLLVEGSDEGARADRLVGRALGLSRAEVADLFAEGAVRREQGAKLARGDRLGAGDRLVVEDPGPWLAPAEDPTLVVLDVSDDLVVVSKPAGVHAHPLRRGEGGTLVDKVAARFPEIAEVADERREGGLVHRLDVGTSGLSLIARTPAAWRALRAAFHDGAVTKTYLALVVGRAGDQEIDRPLAHDPSDKARMVVADGERPARGAPQPARSSVRAVAAGAGASLVEVCTSSGRRHQVRVHLAHAGHPLLGDPLYGGPAFREADGPGLPGPALHALRVELPDGRRFVAAPPPAFLDVARAFGLVLPAHLT